jgi:AbrB family looped-hinge helix DNA binding protein
MAHLGDRGRLVLPAEVRKRLELKPHDLLVIDLDAGALVVRKATDVAHDLRGVLRRRAPDRDLASELIADRRAEAAREREAAAPPR